MERKLPKNIRQIGNVSDNPKVYVEDYVDTFFNQLCEKANENPVGAFLIGEAFRKDDQDYIFIHGAIVMEDLSVKNNDIVIGDKTWKKACEEGKKYFAGNTILGWILVAPGLKLKLNTNLVKLHERLFMKKSRMFVMKESQEKEETFYVYKYNDLMEIGGHYIYYEKNTSMQDYMIANRKQNCVTPSEAFEDRATKNFRSVIQQNEMKNSKNIKHRYSYAISVALVLLVAGIGFASFSGYGALQGVTQIASEVMDKMRGISEESDVETSLYIEESNGTDGIAVQNIEEEEADIEKTDVKEELAQGDEDYAAEELDGEDKDEEEQAEETAEENWKEYTVVEGDTLHQISISICGTREMIEEICLINDLEDSDVIYAGQVLLLPQ